MQLQAAHYIDHVVVLQQKSKRLKLGQNTCMIEPLLGRWIATQQKDDCKFCKCYINLANLVVTSRSITTLSPYIPLAVDHFALVHFIALALLALQR